MGKAWRESRRDRKWLRRLAAGDPAALGLLYDAHGGRLFGLALWITRDRTDAEDVVQEAMVSLAGLGARLLDIRDPRAYLLQMTRREGDGFVLWSAGEDPSYDVGTIRGNAKLMRWRIPRQVGPKARIPLPPLPSVGSPPG